ncbi:MAG: UDP-N-acetylmuramoylalanine--D-glutamate ligase [Pseudohongiellaceae bacterium]
MARWLLAQGAEVLVTDLASRESLGDAVGDLADRGATLILGTHDGVSVESADLLVVNPAVPLHAPLVARAMSAGVAVSSEVALLMERWPGPVVGVTGSNGKSTTVSLTQAILEACGQSAVAGGNLGGSLLERLDHLAEGTVAVLELSSFMLETLALLGQGPDVAVVTNITPNHLDRHGDFASYCTAKAAVMARAHTVVLNADDQVVAGLARPAGSTALWFGSSLVRENEGSDTPHLGVDSEGHIVDAQGRQVFSSDEMPLPGRANRLDLAAAALAASAVVGGLPQVIEALPKALGGFQLPPHRLETVSTRGGVLWVDDSVSTTPESTAASLAALMMKPAQGEQSGRCLLIAGGHDKGLVADPLVAAAAQYTRYVLTIGEEGQRLGEALSAAGVSWRLAGTLEAAVALAGGWAREGDTVVLSPGYSSHDQFVHFAARGLAFRGAVKGLVAPEPLS